MSGAFRRRGDGLRRALREPHGRGGRWRRPARRHGAHARCGGGRRAGPVAPPDAPSADRASVRAAGFAPGCRLHACAPQDRCRRCARRGCSAVVCGRRGPDGRPSAWSPTAKAGRRGAMPRPETDRVPSRKTLMHHWILPLWRGLARPGGRRRYGLARRSTATGDAGRAGPARWSARGPWTAPLVSRRRFHFARSPRSATARRDASCDGWSMGQQDAVFRRDRSQRAPHRTLPGVGRASGCQAKSSAPAARAGTRSAARLRRTAGQPHERPRRPCSAMWASST